MKPKYDKADHAWYISSDIPPFWKRKKGFSYLLFPTKAAACEEIKKRKNEKDGLC
jgi:hypothetical protein